MGRKLLWWCLPPVLLMTMLLCVCAGSVPLSPGETLQILWRGLTGTEAGGSGEAIILRVRLPRVLCVALTGASLSLCGAAMQGLLRNPLADGSTLGVSSGASLGAVLAIVLGMQFPGLPFAGTMVMAMLFAFGSLALILTLAYALDRSLATGTIILIGVVFSMFVSSLMNLLITFAGEKIKSITFWTLGSLSGSTYVNALTLLLALTGLRRRAAGPGGSAERLCPGGGAGAAPGGIRAAGEADGDGGGVGAAGRVRVHWRHHRLCGAGDSPHGTPGAGAGSPPAVACVDCWRGRCSFCWPIWWGGRCSAPLNCPSGW